MAKALLKVIFIALCVTVYTAAEDAIHGKLLSALMRTSLEPSEASPLHDLLVSLNLDEINKKLQLENMPQVSEEIISFVLETFGTNMDELNAKVQNANSLEESIAEINGVFHTRLLYIESGLLRVNFGGAFSIYRQSMNRYLAELHRTNYYMGYIASTIVKTYQRSYLPYFREICDNIQVPLEQGAAQIETRSLSLEERSNVFETVIMMVRSTISSFFEAIINRVDGFSTGVSTSIQRYAVESQPDNIFSGVYAYVVNTVVNRAVQMVAVANRSVANMFQPFVLSSDTRMAVQRSFTWMDWALIPIGNALVTVTGWAFIVFNYLTFTLMSGTWSTVEAVFVGIINVIFHIKP